MRQAPNPHQSVGWCLMQGPEFLACGGIEFDPLGAFLFAYFGPGGMWWRRYPKLGMEAVRRTFALARARELRRLNLIVDPRIARADRFAVWLGAKHLTGALWTIDPTLSRF